MLLPFCSFPWVMTILAWPCRERKTPPPDVEEEPMMEAWHLLKNEEEGGLFPLPTFPHYSPLSSWGTALSPPPTCKRHNSNKSSLVYHFASCWIPSVLRHKKLEFHWVLTPGVWFQLGRFEFSPMSEIVGPSSNWGITGFESHLRWDWFQVPIWGIQLHS